MISLRKVTVDDTDFLYKLYKQRDPRRNPTPKTLNDIEFFVDSYVYETKHYYSAWYIVMVDNKRAGAYTITHDNETGSWLLPEYCNQGIGTKAYKLLFKLQPRKQYKAVVQEWDTRAQALVKKLGYHLTEHHYEYNRNGATDI